jgi:hypothetical protein
VRIWVEFLVVLGVENGGLMDGGMTSYFVSDHCSAYRTPPLCNSLDGQYWHLSTQLLNFAKKIKKRLVFIA